MSITFFSIGGPLDDGFRSFFETVLEISHEMLNFAFSEKLKDFI